MKNDIYTVIASREEISDRYGHIEQYADFSILNFETKNGDTLQSAIDWLAHKIVEYGGDDFVILGLKNGKPFYDMYWQLSSSKLTRYGCKVVGERVKELTAALIEERVRTEQLVQIENDRIAKEKQASIDATEKALYLQLRDKYEND